MSQINTREVILCNGTITASGFGSDINLIQGWQAAVVTLTATAMSGTLPTFNFFVQKKLGQPAAADLVGNPPTGTAIYDDLLAFTTITTNSTRISQIVTAPLIPAANASTITTADWAQSDAALGFGQLRAGPLGGLWRLKWVVTGTTPSGFFSATAQLIPFST